MRRRSALPCVLLALGSLLLLSAATAGARDHEIVPEDYFSLQYAQFPAFSPDGSLVAYIQSGWEGPDGGRMATCFKEPRKQQELWTSFRSWKKRLVISR